MPAQAQAPVLWVSAHSEFRPDKAIRGGVPICFPWFATHGSEPTAPSHGVVRVMDWTLTEASASGDGAVALTFVLDAADRVLSSLWPHRCRATYRLSIGATLAMALEIESRDAAPFTFEEALHTYYSVHDVTQIAIGGLEETEYLDKVEAFARKRQGRDPIRFAGEVDRVYLDTTATCRIADPGHSRAIVVSKSGSRSTVVWNPWIERARAFPDFGDEEWRQMVCVETANVGAAAIRLEPGATHTLRAEISVEPMS